MHSSSGLGCLVVLFCILHINKFSARRTLQNCYRNRLYNYREERDVSSHSFHWLNCPPEVEVGRLVILGASAVTINTFVRGLKLHGVSLMLRFCLVETWQLNLRSLNHKVLFFFHFQCLGAFTCLETIQTN